MSRKTAAGIAAVLLVAASRYYDLPGFLSCAMTWVAAQDLAGVAVYILLYILACILFVPGSVLTLGAGAIHVYPRLSEISKRAAEELLLGAALQRPHQEPPAPALRPQGPGLQASGVIVEARGAGGMNHVARTGIGRVPPQW